VLFLQQIAQDRCKGKAMEQRQAYKRVSQTLNRTAAWNMSTLLRQGLVRHFNEEGLRTLCFDLRIDYDDLTGRGKESLARELVAYCERHDCIFDLIEVAQRLNPNVSWGDAVDQYIHLEKLKGNATVIDLAGIEQQKVEYYPSFMNNERDLRKESVRLERLWRRHHRRLCCLENEQAIHGVNADSSIEIEMDFIKRRMVEIDGRYREISRKLERLTGKASFL
jgi:hypothetical protein